MRRVVFGLLSIAVLASVGAYGYHVGVAHGLAEAAAAAGGPAAAVPPMAWHAGWHYGFGFFPLFPLLFIVFWLVVLRALFWRGAWHRRCGESRVPPAFEEWHRRLHAQQEPPPGAEPRT